MPTEHEFKYVLSLELAKEYSEDQMRAICEEHRAIKQGVICHGPGMYLRIRHSLSNGKPQWYMTFKLKDADRTIEVETELDDRDGNDLWTRCYWTLIKNRYIFEEDGIKWEVDFFKSGEDVYFILAEAELPENAPRPKSMPDFLKNHLMYEVPLTDDRFSNKRLGHVGYAEKMYKELSQGTTNDYFKDN